MSRIFIHKITSKAIFFLFQMAISYEIIAFSKTVLYNGSNLTVRHRQLPCADGLTFRDNRYS